MFKHYLQLKYKYHQLTVQINSFLNVFSNMFSCPTIIYLYFLFVLAESDSSCELASVNRILDATDSQKFQNFLHGTETEDEQEICM